MKTISNVEDVVKFLYFVADDTTDYTQLKDDIYPFNGEPDDQWVVVIGGQAVNWAADYGTACIQYREALRVAKEHAQAGNIPFDGYVPDEPLAYDGDELLFASSADMFPDDYGLEPEL